MSPARRRFHIDRSNVINQSKSCRRKGPSACASRVQELNYRPDPVAKSMKSRHSRNIGVIATESADCSTPMYQGAV
jgi:DNA-binding LacI/PurR family transcriptional regulator